MHTNSIKRFIQNQMDTSKFHTPMLHRREYLSTYRHRIWSILSRARMVAHKNKKQLTQEGYGLILNIKGKPKGTQPTSLYIMYHLIKARQVY